MCEFFRADDAPELFAFLTSTFLGDFDDVPESAGAIGKEGAVFELGILRQLVPTMLSAARSRFGGRVHTVESQFMLSYGFSPPSSHSRRK